MPDGYSPTALIERLPSLKRLDIETRRNLAKRLDALYAEQFLPILRHEVICARADQFLDALRAFETAATNGENTSLEVSHHELRRAAGTLLSEIERLPRGMWLP